MRLRPLHTAPPRLTGENPVTLWVVPTVRMGRGGHYLTRRTCSGEALDVTTHRGAGFATPSLDPYYTHFFEVPGVRLVLRRNWAYQVLRTLGALGAYPSKTIAPDLCLRREARCASRGTMGWNG